MREVPGFLTAFVAGALVAVAEPRLASLALLFGGVGIAATGQARTYGALVACSVFWSVGLHLWLALSPVLVLRLSREGGEGRGLGLMARVGSLAMLTALALVSLLAGRVPYPVFFLLAGLVMAVGGAFAWGVWEGHGGGARQKWVFRKRYSLYYALTLLEGARRQLFQTFAVFALVREFHTPAQVIARLMLLNTLLTVFAAPRVGALMDRVGERRMLTLYYLGLAAVCIGYATARHPWMLYAFFVADSLLITFSVGLTTYLRRICPPEELTASLAMGVTVNHVAAVLVPVSGGMIWQTWGYQRTFWSGVLVALLAVALARRVPDRG
jgi:predicted MFS family arabinose efflux permease